MKIKTILSFIISSLFTSSIWSMLIFKDTNVTFFCGCLIVAFFIGFVLYLLNNIDS
jgi:hypothetical protein